MIDYFRTNLSDDEEKFLGYCEGHSRTPRALFSKEDISRLYDLMGHGPLDLSSKTIRDFAPIYKGQMEEIIDLIKVKHSQNLWLFPEEEISSILK